MFSIERFIKNPELKHHSIFSEHDRRALDVVYRKRYVEDKGVLSSAMRVAIALDDSKSLYKIHKHGGNCDIELLKDAIKHRKPNAIKWLLRNIKFHSKEIVNMLIEYDMIDVLLSMPDLRIGKKMFIYLLDKVPDPKKLYDEHVHDYHYNDELYVKAAEIILRRDLDIRRLQHKTNISHAIKLKLLRFAIRYRRIEYAKELLKDIDHFHRFPDKIVQEMIIPDDQELLDEINNKTL